MALVVTFLFSLYGSYQRREIEVVKLQAAAGGPPSAVALLETYAQLDLVDRLPRLFDDWQRWAVEVLDSHIAYPLLGYFRSSHDNLSWISALGTVLDAASLVLTTIEDVPRGRGEAVQARRHAPRRGHLQPRVPGRRDRQASTMPTSRPPATGSARPAIGSSPDDVAWPRFEAARATYAHRLEAMARYWATPATSWLGDPVELRLPLHQPDDV